MRKVLPILAAAFLAGCGHAGVPAPAPRASGLERWTGATPVASRADEPHLANLRMLTHGGQNAEAYFSPDGRHLVFQATWPGVSQCDQIFMMDVAGRNPRRVSNGEGRTTCAFFLPNGRILYSSTHAASPDCPLPPDRSQGYVWSLDEYDIYTARADGGDVRLLAGAPGYDAEATLSPDGRTIVFTSTRGGDLDIYAMDVDGTHVRQLTHELGYDGGPFFSADGRFIVYRAYHPETPEQIEDYRALLSRHLVRPTTLEIWIMNADGSGKRQVTRLGAASFAPFFQPDGRRIIFSSNYGDPRGREFDLYRIGVDGSGLERITHAPEFDGFPMFTPDGRHLVFASNRGGAHPGDTNIFLADWVESPAAGEATVH